MNRTGSIPFFWQVLGCILAACEVAGGGHGLASGASIASGDLEIFFGPGSGRNFSNPVFFAKP